MQYNLEIAHPHFVPISYIIYRSQWILTYTLVATGHCSRWAHTLGASRSVLAHFLILAHSDIDPDTLIDVCSKIGVGMEPLVIVIQVELWFSDLHTFSGLRRGCSHCHKYTGMNLQYYRSSLRTRRSDTRPHLHKRAEKRPRATISSFCHDYD